MNRFTPKFRRAVALISVLLASCQTTSKAEPGSKDEAVINAWAKYCSAGYCEGFPGVIVGRTEDTLTVNINGHIRYIWFRANGSPGNYHVDMRAKPH
ncbi:MAG: hypothetical protein H6906_13520 [Hyphomicrobiales bacterium]|nr:hypothetical protein [Hyphomicrobiales bacterium]